MRTPMLLFTLFVLVIALPAIAADVTVKGYTTQKGTVVEPYVRTAPDSTPLNNYSTKGNVNPYTGQPGTVNPYAIPSAPGSLFPSPPKRR